MYKKKQKHGFPALLSFFLPGLGQLVKRDISKVLSIWTGGGILIALLWKTGPSFLYLRLGDLPTLVTDITCLKEIPVCFLWCCMTGFAFWIWNVYDAYRTN